MPGEYLQFLKEAWPMPFRHSSEAKSPSCPASSPLEGPPASRDDEGGWAGGTVWEKNEEQSG